VGGRRLDRARWARPSATPSERHKSATSLAAKFSLPPHTTAPRRLPNLSSPPLLACLLACFTHLKPISL